ncbi:MAG TPA: hypothetical protein VGU43_04770 [Thermoplasmata archaeon]|nr:hypothetical protein [Thermoplasmata archaeon]
MRTGLVLVGAALALLGAATVVAAVTFDTPSPVTHESTSQSTLTVPGLGSTTTAPIYGLNGSFSLSWTASTRLNVELTATVCHPPRDPGSCVNQAVANWTAQSQGAWQSSGAPAYPYKLMFSTPGPSPAAVAMTVRSTSTTPTPPSDLFVQLLAGITGAVLASIGVLALFFGLFLRRNVYGARPPPVSRHADDAAEIAADPPPR